MSSSPPHGQGPMKYRGELLKRGYEISFVPIRIERSYVFEDTRGRTLVPDVEGAVTGIRHFYRAGK